MDDQTLVEARVALETLQERLPQLRLADGCPPSYPAGYFFRALDHLDVRW